MDSRIIPEGFLHIPSSNLPYPIAQFFFLGGMICYIVPHTTIFFSKKKKKKLNLAIIPKSIEVPLYTIFKYAIISTKTLLYCCLPTRGYCYGEVYSFATDPVNFIFHFFYLFSVKTCTCQIFFVYCLLKIY